MMPPAHATEAQRRTKVSTVEVVDHLWEKVLVEAGPLEIHSDCELLLREIIEQGVERMTLENRTAPNDIATAEQNLGRFVGLMKRNATLLGHPDWLSEDTLVAADQALVVLVFNQISQNQLNPQLSY